MTQYLILHKVRGEPSFDCAEPVCSGNGKPCQPDCGNWNGGECRAKDEWVTNSGYRAYPVQKWNLADWIDGFNIPVAEVPADWPDHFEVREPPPASKISDIAGLIRGLMPKVKIHRRF